MRPEARDPGYLWDMRNTARETISLLKGKTRADLSTDRVLELAIRKEIEIIGELARRITDEFKGAHPTIPWQAIIGLRNLLIHEYEDIDLDALWNNTLMRLTEFVRDLDVIIAEALRAQHLVEPNAEPEDR